MSRFENYRTRQAKPARNHGLRNKVLVCLLFGLLVFGYFFGKAWLVWGAPNSDSEARVSLTIKPGASLKTIATTLHEKQIIRDQQVWQWYVRYHGLGKKLQAGDYVIQRNLTFEEVVEILQNGRSAEVRITIPEGSTIVQIDNILAKKNLIDSGDFTSCTNTCDLGFRIENLEGFLFPSTYYENVQNFSTKNFIQRLYNTWRQQIKPFEADIPAGRSTSEIMIVASMIEREAFGDSFEEKQMISDVIWKRLDEGIALGIDATTRYAKDDWDGPLFTADFDASKPYDTRRRLGLPPTAISNPGIESIKAAIYPTDTKYYYYLHDNKGQVHFGTTLEEHNENKWRYIN